MSGRVLTLSPDDTVEDALKRLRAEKHDIALAVDSKGVFAGVFSYRIFLDHLLPVSVSVEGRHAAGLNLPIAPGIIKRLKKTETMPISQFLKADVPSVTPDDGIGRAVQLLARGETFVLVRESGSRKILGIIDMVSAFEELLRLRETEE